MDDAAMRALQESAEVTRELMATPELLDALHGILHRACEQDIADAASLTLHTDGRPQTLASSDDDMTVVADELQYQLGEGPCLDAISEANHFDVGDVATDHRWPRWGPQAAQLGVGAIVSVRLFTTADVRGTLNLYSCRVREYDEHDLTVAYAIAAHVSAVLVSIHRDSAVAEVVADALSDRTLIAEAQGRLMDLYGLDADQAFMLLNRLSEDNQLSLRDLAAELVVPSDASVGD